MHFFDFRSDRPRFLDTTSYQYLSFWVKGDKGGEDFAIKLSDAAWIVKEDSIQIGYASDYLKKGVTTEWQEVLVPLADMKDFRLDPGELGGMTLEFMSEGGCTIYIDDVSLKKSSDILTPLTQELPDVSVTDRDFPRAIWVWSADRFFQDAAGREAFFAFCRHDGIKHIWAQVFYAFEPQVSFAAPEPGRARPKTSCVIRKKQEMREFIRAAHKAGLKVHALDGYPEFAQKPYHHAPLALVDALIAFNQETKPDERFDGIHFDNEPYLLMGWQNEDRRRQILREFLELNAECVRRVHQRSDMEFGIDIPFWWQDKNPRTGRAEGEVQFHGQRKAASYHCIDMLDNVGIMNYRNNADGADGMIAHGKDILEYADKVNKAKIFMGIETFAYRPTDVWFALGLPKDDFNTVLKDRDAGLTYLSRVDGYRVQIYDDDSYVHIGIELPEGMNPDQEAEANRTVVKIAQTFGVSGNPKYQDKIDQFRRSLRAGVSGELEWQDIRRKDAHDPVTRQEYAGFVATSIMLSKITFANRNLQDMKLQVGAAEEYFGKFRSYTGIAVHFDQTYLRKFDEAKQSSAIPATDEPQASTTPSEE
jgi:hypothetical protein